MAKYYANTEIRFGEADDDGVQKKLHVIAENDEVTGLPKEVMAELWNAGSLRMEGGDAKDPRIEAARHASYTGEGVDNDLTNPDKAGKEDKAPVKSTPATGKPPVGSPPK
jgi:hypothetical protein